MNYMGDNIFWDNRYGEKERKLPDLEPTLMEEMELWNFTGYGLELACGEGKNLICLATRGASMTGVDFSEEALDRLNSYAKERDIDVNTIRADLNDKSFIDKLKKYDFIIINHYRLPIYLYKEIFNLLKPNGFIWVNSYIKRPSVNPLIREEDVMTMEDFKDIEDYVIDKRLYNVGEREFIRIVFKK